MSSTISVGRAFYLGSRPIKFGSVATAVLLGYVGPFGSTDAFGQILSTVFWALVIVASIGSVGALRHLVTSRTTGWSDLQRELLLLCIFIVVFTPQLHLLLWLFDPSRGLDVGEILELGAQVGAISLWIAAMRYVLLVWRKEADPEVGQSSQPRLFQRLEGIGDAEVLRLSAEDHYTVVVLSNGSTQRILLRLSDGIAEMDGVEGYVTHRSHWVAASAVAGTRREKGRVFLSLTNGDEVPVSRGYQSALKSAGLLS